MKTMKTKFTKSEIKRIANYALTLKTKKEFVKYNNRILKLIGK